MTSTRRIPMTPGPKESTCQQVTDFLTDYLAGGLGWDERRLFDAHLAACPECVAYLRSYAATVRLAKAACRDHPAPAPVPEQLVRAILEAREARLH